MRLNDDPPAADRDTADPAGPPGGAGQMLARSRPQAVGWAAELTWAPTRMPGRPPAPGRSRAAEPALPRRVPEQAPGRTLDAAPGRPTAGHHDVGLGERGSFTVAGCSCGWNGWARRSRWRALQDGAAHQGAAQPAPDPTAG